MMFTYYEGHDYLDEWDSYQIKGWHPFKYDEVVYFDIYLGY